MFLLQLNQLTLILQLPKLFQLSDTIPTRECFEEGYEILNSKKVAAFLEQLNQ
jgi:hypothetical protein